MQEIKQMRKKPAIITGVVMVLLYMGIKYARELFFIDKFDEQEKCEANELAEFFPPKDKEDEYKDKVTKFLIKVNERGIPLAKLPYSDKWLKTVCIRANLKRGIILRVLNKEKVWEEFRLS